MLDGPGLAFVRSQCLPLCPAHEGKHVVRHLLGSAVLKRFYDDEQPERDLPFAQWGIEHALDEVERALVGVLDNLPSRAMAALLRLIVFPFGPRRRPPSDALGTEVARALLEEGGRERLTADMYVPRFDEPGLGLLENALGSVVRAAPIAKKLRQLVRDGKIEDAPPLRLAERAWQARLITKEEYAAYVDMEAARREAIQVDAFDGAPSATMNEHPEVSTVTSAARFTPMGRKATGRT